MDLRGIRVQTLSINGKNRFLNFMVSDAESLLLQTHLPDALEGL